MFCRIIHKLIVASRLTVVFILATAMALNAKAQPEFDYTNLPSMDAYSQPDIVTDSVYSVDNKWNELNFAENRREAKIAKLREFIIRNRESFVNLPGINGVGSLCGSRTYQMYINFTGIENFTNYEGFDFNHDGEPEGYDFYVDYTENGRENIPLYFVSVKKKNGESHY